MAKIPTLDDQQGLLPDRAIEANLNVNQAGSAYEGLASLGDSIQKVSTQLLEMRSKADATTWQLQTQSKNSLDFQQDSQNYKEQNRDLSGYSDYVQKWWSDRAQKDQDAAPNGFASSYYQRYASDTSTHDLLTAHEQENVQRSKNVDLAVDDTVQQAGSDIVANPTPQNLHLALQRTNDAIDLATGTAYDQELATKKKVQKNAEIAITYANSLNNEKGYNTGIRYLRGLEEKDSDGTPVANYIPPEQRANLLDHFYKAAETDQREKAINADQSLRNVMTTALSTGQLDQKAIDQVSATIPLIKSPEKQAELAGRIAILTKTVQSVANMKDESLQDLDQIAAGKGKFSALGFDDVNASIAAKYPNSQTASNPSFLAEDKEQFKNVKAALAANLAKQARADPATYVTSRDKQLSSLYVGSMAQGQDATPYVQAATAAMKAKGFDDSEIRVIPNSQSEEWASAFASGTPQQKATTLNYLQQKFGSNTGQILDEVSTSPNGSRRVPVDVKYALLSDSLAGRAEILRNMDAKETALSRENNDPQKGSQIRDAINAQAGDLIRAASASGIVSGSSESDAEANSIRTNLTKSALRNMENFHEDATSAVQRARNTMYSGFVPVTASGNNTSVMVPTSAADPKVVQGFVSAYSRPENLNRLQIADPYTNKLMNPDDISRSASNFFWTSGPGFRDVYLMKSNPTTRQVEPVKNKQGQFIKRNLQDPGMATDPAVLREIR